MIKNNIISWIVLCIALAITSLIWIAIVNLDIQAHEIEFELLSERATLQILEKLKNHEQILMGFAGLFSASQIVEPNEFSNFYMVQKIEKRFSDNQGVGYIQYISNEGKKNELEYPMYPDSKRGKYFPVVFLEPRDFRNIRALGYDVYSEEIRRQAIDQAVKTGDTTLTGKIILAQETDIDIQNGFLMLLPVYKYSENKNTADEFLGLVYSVFIMNDFIKNTLDEGSFEHLDFRIYDNTVDSESVFFDSGHNESRDDENMFSSLQTIDFGGRQWVLDFTGEPALINHLYEKNWYLIPIIGYSMSFLLFYILVLFSRNTQMTKNMLKREKIANIGELASRFSHDIRNPLSNIQMAIEILQKNKDVTVIKPVKEKFEIITKNLDRISHQVDDVLNFVRITPLEREMIDPLSCLSESIVSIKIPKNIKMNVPNECNLVYADSYNLQIVCKNLILNAIQAIESNDGNITIRFKNESKYNIIEIENSGPVIPESQLSKIFEPLITSKQEGTGLGLASCKNIVEQHGGTITARNNPTTFTIKLPKS